MPWGGHKRSKYNLCAECDDPIYYEEEESLLGTQDCGDCGRTLCADCMQCYPAKCTLCIEDPDNSPAIANYESEIICGECMTWCDDCNAQEEGQHTPIFHSCCLEEHKRNHCNSKSRAQRNVYATEEDLVSAQGILQAAKSELQVLLDKIPILEAAVAQCEAHKAKADKVLEEEIKEAKDENENENEPVTQVTVTPGLDTENIISHTLDTTTEKFPLSDKEETQNNSLGFSKEEIKTNETISTSTTAVMMMSVEDPNKCKPGQLGGQYNGRQCFNCDELLWDGSGMCTRCTMDFCPDCIEKYRCTVCRNENNDRDAYHPGGCELCDETLMCKHCEEYKIHGSGREGYAYCTDCQEYIGYDDTSSFGWDYCGGCGLKLCQDCTSGEYRCDGLREENVTWCKNCILVDENGIKSAPFQDSSSRAQRAVYWAEKDLTFAERMLQSAQAEQQALPTRIPSLERTVAAYKKQMVATQKAIALEEEEEVVKAKKEKEVSMIAVVGTLKNDKKISVMVDEKATKIASSINIDAKEKSKTKNLSSWKTTTSPPITAPTSITSASSKMNPITSYFRPISSNGKPPPPGNSFQPEIKDIASKKEEKVKHGTTSDSASPINHPERPRKKSKSSS